MFSLFSILLQTRFHSLKVDTFSKPIMKRTEQNNAFIKKRNEHLKKIFFYLLKLGFVYDRVHWNVYELRIFFRSWLKGFVWKLLTHRCDMISVNQWDESEYMTSKIYEKILWKNAMRFYWQLFQISWSMHIKFKQKLKKISVTSLLKSIIRHLKVT